MKTADKVEELVRSGAGTAKMHESIKHHIEFAAEMTRLGISRKRTYNVSSRGSASKDDRLRATRLVR